KERLYSVIIQSFQENTDFMDQHQSDLKIAAIEAMPYMDGHTGETVSLLANLITSTDKYGELAIISMFNYPDERLKEVDLHPLKTNIQNMLQKEEKGTVSKELLLLGKKTGALLSGEEQREFLELVESSETLVIQLSTLPGKMDFDLKNFTVPTGRSV